MRDVLAGAMVANPITMAWHDVHPHLNVRVLRHPAAREPVCPPSEIAASRIADPDFQDGLAALVRLIARQAARDHYRQQNGPTFTTDDTIGTPPP